MLIRVKLQRQVRQICFLLNQPGVSQRRTLHLKMAARAKFFDSTISTKGEFMRKDSSFRNWITADGSSGFKAEGDRYHLYVSLACPWAHRTLIARKLKGLEDVIPYTVVDWLMGEKGWNFTDKKPKCSPDPLFNAQYVRELYFKANPDYEGRFTVPMLWDKKNSTIVTNESSEIIQMFNSEFNDFCATPEQKELDLYPEHLKAQVDGVNEWIYNDINNGVYKSGFARSQEAYDKAVTQLFASLDRVEEILSKTRYLTGNQLTLADIRLFTTLVRFDPVYVGHFKCNKKRIMDYPNLWGYTRDVYQTPGVAETVDREHIEKHYQQSHTSINPFAIVAIGPELDFNLPHNRDKMTKA
ncbi:glutathionyl-hydroquinone reductase YqjG-like isoform X1 [Branchiostoma lanceolatum]|uniref:glutathionyl-hydroquinone reductase YqjG-like isoform X1 n=2 Tax=Branchiostoma lanceolatum TaxID=7740 RepID=UPI003453BB7B